MCARRSRSERRTGETRRFVFAAPTDVAQLFRDAVWAVGRHIEKKAGLSPSVGETVEAMLDHALESWGIGSARVRKEFEVFARDGWRCTAPGCSSYRNLHDHHIVFRSAGGSDELSNRTTLCAWHHLRGVHAGVIGCRGTAPYELEFALGLRATGPPLAVYLSGDRIKA